jgi:hypothetical protein
VENRKPGIFQALLAVAFSFSCGPGDEITEVSLYRLREASCHDCREITLPKNPYNRSTRVKVATKPDLHLSQGDLLRIEAVEVFDSLAAGPKWKVEIIPTEEGYRAIDGLAALGSDEDLVLVEVNGNVLGVQMLSGVGANLLGEFDSMRDVQDSIPAAIRSPSPVYLDGSH